MQDHRSGLLVGSACQIMVPQMSNRHDRDRGKEPRLAVVIPMYNELAVAENCIRRVLDVLPTVGTPTGLIAVDDGSSDGTGELLECLRQKLGGFRVLRKLNGGYGSAISAGARLAQKKGYNYVLFMDSDLTNPPEHIPRFVPPILQGFDLIKATRLSHGGDMSGVPWRRRIHSISGNVIAQAMFRMDLADCTNGFRAIRVPLFLKMPLGEPGFAIILEELYWAKRWGMRVAAVPTSLSARSVALRPSAFDYRPGLIWRYLRHALRAGPLIYRPDH